MRLSFLVTLFLVSILSIGCSEDDKKTKKSTHIEAMHKLSPAPATEDCPEISGEFLCQVQKQKDLSYRINLTLSKDSNGAFHLTFPQSPNSSPSDRTFEEIVFGTEGLVLNSQVQNTYQEKQAAYVGYCKKGIVRIHHTYADVVATKLDIRKAADDQIVIHSAKYFGKNHTQRSKAVCRSVSSAVR